MAALGSLVVELSANTAKFTSAMDKAAYQTEQVRRKMESDAKMIGAAVGTMAAVGAGALVAMVKSSLDAMDNMSKLAQQTGTAVESLSALSYAAGLSGVNTDALGSAMVKLSKNMSDAGQGTGEAIKGFEALGINIKNADGSMKNSDVVISELAQKFATFKDGAEKTALAVNLFGKTGAQLIPLLNSGADGIKVMADEAARMGLVMDTETSKAAEKFNDDMSRLIQTQTAFANSITKAVLPVLQAVATEMLGSANASNQFSSAGAAVRTVLETFVVVGSEVAFVFKAVGTEIGGIAAQLAALARGDFKGFTAISDAMRADAAKARQEHDAFLATIMDRSGASQLTSGLLRHQSGGTVLGSAPSIGGKTGGARSTARAGLTDAQKIEQDAQRFVARLREQAETYGKSDLAALQYQLTLAKFPQQYKDEAIALQQRIDSYKEADAEQIAFFDNAVKASEERKAVLDRLMSPTTSASIERARADMLALADALEKGVISEKDYLEAVSIRLDLTADKTAQTNDLAKDLGLTFSSAFEDAIVGGKDLGDVLSGLEQDILRIVTRKMVTEPLGNAITGAIGGSGFNPGNLIASLFSADGGGYTGSGSRSGGLDGKGGFMAMLHPQETVIDHTKGQRSGNTVNVTVNQSFAAGTSRATTMQAAADARRQLEYAGRNL